MNSLKSKMFNLCADVSASVQVSSRRCISSTCSSRSRSRFRSKSSALTHCTRPYYSYSMGPSLFKAALESMSTPHRIIRSGGHRVQLQPTFLQALQGSTLLQCCCRIHNDQVRKMSGEDALKGLDKTQAQLMAEECILVDKDDNVIGSASKKDCHLLANINKGMLHRAFSVFLFNSKNELLLQQRASEKITFPDQFTNTCCSHPLNFEAELDGKDAIGVKRAAQRKLKHELGIEPKQVPLEDFHYLTRMSYKVENVPKDNKWGEHEIDYILIIQCDVDVVPNPNEVKSYRYVSQAQLREFMDSADSKGVLITPWFRLIVNNFLYKWWNKLDDLETLADRDTIHRM